MGAHKFLENKKFFPLLVTGITIANMALVGCAGGGSPIPSDKALAIVPPPAAAVARSENKIAYIGDITVGPDIKIPPDITAISELPDLLPPTNTFDSAAHGVSGRAQRVAWSYSGDDAIALAERLQLDPKLGQKGNFVIYYKGSRPTAEVRYNTLDAMRAFDAKMQAYGQLVADGLAQTGVKAEVFPWGSGLTQAYETPEGFTIYQNGSKWLVRQGGVKVSDYDFFLQPVKGNFTQILSIDNPQVIGLMQYLQEKQPALLAALLSDKLHLFTARGPVLEKVPAPNGGTAVKIIEGKNLVDVYYIGSLKVVAKAFGNILPKACLVFYFVQPLQTPLKFMRNDEQLPGLSAYARLMRGAAAFWSDYSGERTDLQTQNFTVEWPAASLLPDNKTEKDEYLNLMLQTKEGERLDFPWFFMKKGEKPDTVVLKFLKPKGSVFAAAINSPNRNDIVQDTAVIKFGEKIVITYPPDAEKKQMQLEVEYKISDSDLFRGQKVIWIHNLGVITQNPNLPVTFAKAQTP